MSGSNELLIGEVGMNKQIILIFIFILLGSLQVSGLAAANPIPYPATPSPEKPTLNIETPLNNSSYSNTNSIALNFSVVQPSSWSIDYDFFNRLGQITGIEVSVDGNLCSCPYNSTVIATNSPQCVTPPLVNYSIMLNHLTSGIHQVNVTVIAYSFYANPIDGSQNIPVPKNSFTLYEYPIVVSDTVRFTIAPPEILIISPQAISYDQSYVPLSFWVNETTSKMQYSLDGQEVTMTGNSTLTNLSDGSHNVTVYATDEAGNTGNQTVNFMVEKPQMFGNVLSIAAVAIPVAAVCLIAGLLLYRRQQMTQNK